MFQLQHVASTLLTVMLLVTKVHCQYTQADIAFLGMVRQVRDLTLVNQSPEIRKIAEGIELQIDSSKGFRMPISGVSNGKPFIRFYRQFGLANYVLSRAVLSNQLLNDGATNAIDILKPIAESLRTSNQLPDPLELAKVPPSRRKEVSSINFLNQESAMYMGSLTFFYCHELAHHVLGHFDDKEGNMTLQVSRELELAADDWSSEVMMSSGQVPAVSGIMLFVYALIDEDESLEFLEGSHPAPMLRSERLFNHSAMVLPILHRDHPEWFVGLNYPDIYKQMRFGAYQSTYSLLGMAERDPDYYEERARQGDALAQLFIGYFYMVGRPDLKQNLDRAIYWLSRSAKDGVGTAALLVGLLYEGLLGDYDLAIYWYEEGLDMDNVMAFDLFTALNRLPFEEVDPGGVKIRTCIKNLFVPCVKDCMDNFSFSEQQCRENHCLLQFVNLHAWVWRCQREIFGN